MLYWNAGVPNGSALGNAEMNTQTFTVAPSRRDRLVREQNHDPYKTKSKLREPTVCPVCNAVYRDGRWQWADSWPVDSKQALCQACQRIKDGYPAGVITLRGKFVMRHKMEILNLARNLEAGEKLEHPLHRIMKSEELPDAIVVSTTDIHLPRRIVDALHHAYKGEWELAYSEGSCFIRANWMREE